MISKIYFIINLCFTILLFYSCSNDDDIIEIHEHGINVNIDTLKNRLKIEYDNESYTDENFKLANQILKYDSNYIDALEYLSIYFYNKSNYNKSLEYINSCLIIKPTAYIYHIKGQIFTALRNSDSASFYLQKADTLGNNPIYLIKLSEYHKKNNNYYKAIEIIDKALLKYSNNATLLGLKASNYIGLEKWNEAIEYYSLAEKEIQSDELYYGRAIAYSNINKLNLALIDINLAIQKNPLPNYFCVRGRIKYFLKDTNGAIKDLKTSSEMGDPEGNYFYKELLSELKKTKNI